MCSAFRGPLRRRGTRSGKQRDEPHALASCDSPPSPFTPVSALRRCRVLREIRRKPRDSVASAADVEPAGAAQVASSGTVAQTRVSRGRTVSGRETGRHPPSTAHKDRACRENGATVEPNPHLPLTTAARSLSGPPKIGHGCASVANEQRYPACFLVEVRPAFNGEANAFVETVRHLHPR